VSGGSIDIGSGSTATATAISGLTATATATTGTALVNADAGCDLNQLKRRYFVSPLKHREIGYDHVDDVFARQRERASRNEFGQSVLGIMLHHDDDFLPLFSCFPFSSKFHSFSSTFHSLQMEQ
jgi:hypothetical protein